MRKTAVISGIFLFLLTAVLGSPYLAQKAYANPNRSFTFLNQEGYEVIVTIESAPANGGATRTAKPGGSPSQNFTAGTHVGITNLYRYPSGYGSWFPYPMLLNTATGLYNGYYRDSKSGVAFYAANAVDLDTWTVTMSMTQATADPLWSGSRTFTMSVATVKYHSFLPTANNGWPGWDCFVINGIYTTCQGPGNPYANVSVSINTKCSTPGVYDFTVSYNGGVETSRGDFYLYPEVSPDDLLAFDQLTNSNVLDHISPITIRDEGCALTSTAMVLYAHGERFGQNPFSSDVNAETSLNEYMKSLEKGFEFSENSDGTKTYNGRLIFPLTVGYTGGVVKWAKSRPKPNDLALRMDICGGGPQVMKVKNGKHFVMVTGRAIASTGAWTWKIYDPAGGKITNLVDNGYNGSYNGTRTFKHIADTMQGPLPRFYVEFRLHSPAEIVVTDPNGKRTGLDPTRGVQYSDIPESGYEEEGYDNPVTGHIDPHPVKILHIDDPIDGEYLVEVIGTGSGTYRLQMIQGNNDIYAPVYPEKRVNTLDVPIQPGEVHKYSLSFTAASAAKPRFIGGFDGGGQKPSDVNKFLRYIRPADSRVALPVGTVNYKLSVSYGATVVPGTLKADVDGVVISQSFNPAPGKTEDVVIPLKPGSNTLTLSIDGATQGGRTATDTDRFTFIVK